MSVNPNASLEDIIRRIGNLERAQQRQSAARVLSPGIGPADFGAVAANNVLVGTGSGVTARQIVTADITAANISQLTSSYATGTAFGPGAWSYISVGITISGLIPGVSRVFVFSSTGFVNNTVGAVVYLGIAVDNPSFPSVYVQGQQYVANWGLPFATGFWFTATATAHALYPVGLANAGTTNPAGPTSIVALEMKR